MKCLLVQAVCLAVCLVNQAKQAMLPRSVVRAAHTLLMEEGMERAVGKMVVLEPLAVAEMDVVEAEEAGRQLKEMLGVLG